MNNLRIYENFEKKYIIVGYNSTMPIGIIYYYYAEDAEGYRTLTKQGFLEMLEQGDVKIYFNRRKAEIDLKIIRKELNYRPEIRWYIEDYEDYEVEMSTKKYNL